MTAEVRQGDAHWCRTTHLEQQANSTPGYHLDELAPCASDCQQNEDPACHNMSVAAPVTRWPEHKEHASHAIWHILLRVQPGRQSGHTETVAGSPSTKIAASAVLYETLPEPWKPTTLYCGRSRQPVSLRSPRSCRQPSMPCCATPAGCNGEQLLVVISSALQRDAEPSRPSPRSRRSGPCRERRPVAGCRQRP
jgi:hypothetical protein